MAAALRAAPITGMYHVPDDSFAMVKELGIDMVQVSIEYATAAAVVRDKLDKAQSLGLETFFGVYRFPFEVPDAITQIQTYVRHPGIKYWYLIDEPDIHDVSPDFVRQLSEYVHLADYKKRPTFITLSDLNYGKKEEGKVKIRGKSYRHYKNTADTIGILHYGTPKEVRIYLKAYVFPEIEGKPWWAIVPLNRTPGDLKKIVEYFMEGKPQGIIYYAFADESWGFDLKQRQDLQQALQEINYTIKGLPLPMAKAKQGLGPPQPGQASSQAGALPATGPLRNLPSAVTPVPGVNPGMTSNPNSFNPSLLGSNQPFSGASPALSQSAPPPQNTATTQAQQEAMQKLQSSTPPPTAPSADTVSTPNSSTSETPPPAREQQPRSSRREFFR